MTLCSQHENRGKTQVLATCQEPDIVDARNRVAAALAVVPLSVHDLRARCVADKASRFPTKLHAPIFVVTKGYDDWPRPSHRWPISGESRRAAGIYSSGCS